MFMILLGNPVTKKNSQRIITIGGHPRILQSKRYLEYQASCLEQIRYMYRDLHPVREGSTMVCVYHRQDNRRCDLSNLLEATQDILVEAGVLPDDGHKYLRRIVAQWGEPDKARPRVEITIVTVEGEEHDQECV